VAVHVMSDHVVRIRDVRSAIAWTSRASRECEDTEHKEAHARHSATRQALERGARHASASLPSLTHPVAKVMQPLTMLSVRLFLH